MQQFDVLKDLVRFNTIKDKDNEGIINYIEEYLKNLGFKTEYKTKALVMSIGENPKLGFLGHTDTVEYIDDFKTPFELIRKGDYLYGLGVCDMKGGISAMLEAISKTDFSKLKSGIKMYLTYDEEINFGGIDELIKNGIQFPEYMIFGEPTNNELYTGHKGLIELKVEFKGLKAHSSNPDKGISANMNAVKFLYELDSFYNAEIKKDEAPEYAVPFTTMNNGVIDGGSAFNSVSAFCVLSLDFRVAKTEHINKIMNKIKELSEKYQASVKVMEIVEPFVDKIDFVYEVKTTNFMTEAARVPNSKRIILGVGPVTAHEVNENITIQSYEKLINQYIELIKRVCS